MEIKLQMVFKYINIEIVKQKNILKIYRETEKNKKIKC